MAEKRIKDGGGKGDGSTVHRGAQPAEEVPLNGDCLTPEELADVATGHCSTRQRQRALAHFAGCPSCYEAWVTLSFTIAGAGERAGSRSRSSKLMRNAIWFGTAFAIAAALLFFFSVRHRGAVGRQGVGQDHQTTISRMKVSRMKDNE